MRILCSQFRIFFIHLANPFSDLIGNCSIGAQNKEFFPKGAEFADFKASQRAMCMKSEKAICPEEGNSALRF